MGPVHEAYMQDRVTSINLTGHFVAGQEPHTSEADGGDISWDIDISAAEGADQAEEGLADIDWDADPMADGDTPAHNIDWDIGVDANAVQKAPELTQTGKNSVLCLVTMVDLLTAQPCLSYRCSAVQ